jgi:REP-associated tyrosine transposase
LPRKARMFLLGVPRHITRRGNNLDASFYTDDDYIFYLEYLSEACDKRRVSVHAYVLMVNHVHLLLTLKIETCIPDVIQSIGRRYVQYINKTLQAFW